MDESYQDLTPTTEVHPPSPPEQGDGVYMILLTLEWGEHICATLAPSQRLAEEAQAQ